MPQGVLEREVGAGEGRRGREDIHVRRGCTSKSFKLNTSRCRGDGDVYNAPSLLLHCGLSESPQTAEPPLPGHCHLPAGNSSCHWVLPLDKPGCCWPPTKSLCPFIQ